ncbi:PRTRC system protein E [Polaromonas aquatica]|uniref:PRTRC system protein E n=1 Tax=Polaromonas aquatica TaxID=332657 RepID=A0ABW1TWP9_9BURK
MTLFTKFSPLVKAGVVVHLTMRQVGNDMQLEILPVCDAGKTGISVPPRAFLASPEELDEKIPGLLETYVSAAVDINYQIAVTVAVMDKAQEDAREATKKAQQAKPSTPARTSTSATSGTKPAKPRNTNAGFLDEPDDGDDGGDGAGGQPDEVPQGGEAAPAATSTDVSLF